MASRMVWCAMSSRVPVFLLGTDYILSLHFHNRYIAWKYRKTANIIEKTSVYHTVKGNRALFHTKMIKVRPILLSSTLTF